MIQAICEGECNPRIEWLDGAVRDFREAEDRLSRGGARNPISDELAAELRTLRHTPHQKVDGMHASCVVCGRVRVWITAA